MKQLIILILFLSVSFSLFATDYYVDPVNGDDANDGLSTNTAYQTIYGAFKGSFPYNYKVAGDTVYLRGGIYTGNVNAVSTTLTNSGTFASPITMAAYPGETPVIAGIVSPYVGFQLNGQSWYVFDGITWSNCYKHITMTSCTNIVVTNCTFGWANKTNSMWAGIYIAANSATVTVQNCTFTDWGQINSDWEDIGTNIQIMDATTNDSTHAILIENNTFNHGGHDCLDIRRGASNVVIRNNYFHNEEWMQTNDYPVVGSDPKGLGLSAYGNRLVELSGGSRILIESNRFHYAGVHPDSGGGGQTLDLSGINNSIIRKNTCAFGWKMGMWLESGSATNYIYNNVVYGSSELPEDSLSWRGGIISSSFNPDTSASNRIVNNIVWNNDAASSLGEFNSYTLTWNLLRANFTNDLSDPLMVDATDYYTYDGTGNQPDFSLQTSSPCIDAGVFLAFVTSVSGSGTSVVVDDAGYFCDGFDMVNGDVIQFEGSTDTFTLTDVDYATDTVTLDSSATWTNGQGVSLVYYGSAPDQGAYESNYTAWPYAPDSPPNRLWWGVP